VDYGLGNLFSVQRALHRVGSPNPIISNQKGDVESAGYLILPGVGAFGDGMNNLRRLGLVPIINDYAASGRPLLGVCLGMQLIMTESEEFGHHKGLDLLPGRVRLLRPGSDRRFKVPHIGWNSLLPPHREVDPEQAWQGTILSEIPNDSFMYFVHSYVVAPDDPAINIASTRYGEDEYCSVLKSGNITAAQFHPELSGEDGLSIYRSFLNNN
jgi:glutamine amidotransferase